MPKFAARLLGVAAPAALMASVFMTGPAQAVTSSAPNSAKPASAQSASNVRGCPLGAVCIYPGAGWNGNNPSHVYWSYGAHNLSNMYGVHRIYNHQTGGATMRTCTGYNGVGCQGYLPANNYIDKNLTPINSITLQP